MWSRGRRGSTPRRGRPGRSWSSPGSPFPWAGVSWCATPASWGRWRGAGVFRPGAEGAGADTGDVASSPRTAYIADNQKLSGLSGNDLPRWLTSRGINTVLLTGVATNLTVEQTARHGTDLGLTVYVVSDCVAAADEATHAASLANLELKRRAA